MFCRHFGEFAASISRTTEIVSRGWCSVCQRQNQSLVAADGQVCSLSETQLCLIYRVQRFGASLYATYTYNFLQYAAQT
jgi:hypothetical protein